MLEMTSPRSIDKTDQNFVISNPFASKYKRQFDDGNKTFRGKFDNLLKDARGGI